jgi:hypothetical protein
MQGCNKGVRTQVQEVAPNAAYMHCCAHNLNLCVNDVAKLSTFIEEFFSTLQGVYCMCSASTKRQARFDTKEAKSAASTLLTGKGRIRRKLLEA